MKYLTFTLVAIALSCSSQSGGHADGEACTNAGDCSSGACAAGFCSGTTCECDPLIEQDCSTAPRVDEDCQSGWMCVSTIATLHVSGFCRLPCSKGCPSTWTCLGDGFCGYDAPEPSVTIDSAPTEVEVGSSASFSASASSPNGAITTIAWAFGDGDTAEGAAVSHAYTDAGTFTYTATA